MEYLPIILALILLAPFVLIAVWVAEEILVTLLMFFGMFMFLIGACVAGAVEILKSAYIAIIEARKGKKNADD